jgi:hypothetical protein
VDNWLITKFATTLPPNPPYCHLHDSIHFLISTSQGVLHLMDKVATQHGEIVRTATAHWHAVKQFNSKRHPPKVC